MITDLQLATNSRKVSGSGLFELWVGLPLVDSVGMVWVLEKTYDTSEAAKKSLENDLRGMYGDYDLEVRCPAAFRARHLTLEKAKMEREQKAYLESKEFSEIPF